MAYDVGTAVIHVNVAFEGIERQLRNLAEKIGKDLNDQVGKKLNAGVGDSLEQATRKASRPAKAAGAKLADDFAGSYARRVREAIARTLRDLPRIDVAVGASTDARRMEAVRRELLGLFEGDRDFLNTPEGLRRLRELRGELEELSRDAESVQLRMDADAGRQSLRQFFDSLSTEAERAAQKAAAAQEEALRRAQERLAEQAARQEEQVRQAAERAAERQQAQAERAAERARAAAERDAERARVQAERAAEQARVQAERAAERARAKAERDAERAAAEARRVAERTARDQVRQQQQADREARRLRERAQREQERADRQAAREAEKAAQDAAREAEKAFGSTFAGKVRDQLTKAYQSIPDLEIEADTGPVQRRLAEIRAELARASQLQVGIDIPVHKALAQVARLRRELAFLAKDADITVDVQADTVAAAGNLAVIDNMARSLDGRQVNLRIEATGRQGVDQLGNAASTALSRLEGIIATSLSLGTALVPAAAAAASAIGLIGTAAAAASAGIGVMILGFVGIGDAVKALQKYTEDAAKSQVSLANAAASVASANDAVVSAERSLANVRANNADGARRAARAVEEAERGVARAQEEARRATLDLVRAREEERRANQDLAFDIEGLRISQRQATLDQIEAKRELDAVLANPKATKEQREQAQITYDQISLRIRELAVQQERATAKQREATRVGVEGSERVQAAHERVRDATDGVAAAQERVAEAQAAQRSQARQAAFALQQAQQAVTSALRSQAQAVQRQAVAGGEALDNLRTSLDKLSPAGQRFAIFLHGLRDDVLELRDAAQENMLPGFEQAIRNLLPSLPAVRNFIGRVAGAIGNMAAEVTDFLAHDPTWRRFWRHVSLSTVPTMQLMYRVGRNLATGLAGLVMAFIPFNAPIGEGLEKLTERFAKWAAELDRNPSFETFLEYVRDNGPTVVALIGELTEFIARFVAASAPIGAIVVEVFTALVGALNAIPLPVLEVLIGLLALYTGALLLANTQSRLAAISQGMHNRSMQIATGTATAAATAMTAYRNAALLASANTAAFGRTMGTLRTSMTLAGRAASGLVGLLGGPWGVALVAATLVAVHYSRKLEEQKARISELATALRQLGEAYKETGSVSSDAVKQVILHSEQLTNLINESRTYGLTVGQIARAASGERQAHDEVIQALRAKRDAANQVYEIERTRLIPWASEKEKSAKAERDSLDETIKALERQFGQTTRAAEAARLLEEAQGGVASTAPAVTGTQQALADAMATLADDTASATEKINALRTAQELLEGGQKSQTEAAEAYAAATDGLTAALTASKGSLDLNTAAGRAARDALQERLQASIDMYNADVAAKVPIEEATRRHNERIKAIREESKVGKEHKGELEKLIETYGRIPTDVETKLAMAGFDPVYAKLYDAKVIQHALLNNIDPARSKALLDAARRKQERGPAMAEGGLVTGPGTGTSDDVPLWGSRGEFMQQAAAVRYYGLSFMRAINERAIPKRRVVRGYATGGLVEEWPYVVDVTKTPVPTRDEIIRSTLPMTTGGIGSADMMKLLRVKFPKLQLYSGFRRGSRTASGNLSYHAMVAEDGDLGRAVDVPPIRAVFDYIHDKYRRLTRELIWGGDPSRNIHNGRYHRYSDTLLRQHGPYRGKAGPSPHIHWAYDSGGLLPPGVSTVVNNTGRPELVLNPAQTDAMVQWARNSHTEARTQHIYNFKEAALDHARLRAIEDRQNARARVGRPG